MMQITKAGSRVFVMAASLSCMPIPEAFAQSSNLATTLKEAAFMAVGGKTNKAVDADNEVATPAKSQRSEKQSKGNPARSLESSSAAKPGSAIARQYESGATKFVHANRAFARSGPGDSHYPTSELPQGSSVEVFTESNDGWSGIRPLADSHNWIPAKSAYLLPGGNTAEIVEEYAPAWVGTNLEQPRSLHWQSTLSVGQIVQVLGEQSQKSHDGTTSLWYKIAPPQGEFRWVRTSLLSSEQVPPRDTSVHQASHQASSTSSDSAVQVATAQMVESSDGEIVWSDESNAIAEVNRQIRAEQGKLNQGLPSGARIDNEYLLDDGYMGDTLEDGSIVEGEFIDGSTMSGDYLGSVEEALTPEDIARNKRHKNAQHQVDSLQHWDSLEVSDPKLKLKPLASVLGLIGFGVVETERAPAGAVATGSNLPIQSQINRERNQFPQGSLDYGQTLSNLNAPTGSRLDRLPRPGRAAKISSPQPGRNPLAGIPNSAVGSNGYGSSPIDPNKPVLTRLWSSDQPLFGHDPAQQPYFASGQVNAVAQQPIAGAYQWYALNQPIGNVSPSLGVPPSLEWHADHNPSTLATSQRMNEAFADPMENAEFETPEIQSAMLDLTRIVAQPTENWSLNHLRDQCQRWIDQGGSSLVRGEARLLLERVDRFDALRTRTLGSLIDPNRLAMQSSSNAGGIGQGNVPVQFASSVQDVSAYDGVSQASAHGVPGVADANARAGDASGWLVQVHGALPGQPEFALTDDQGKVVTYVQTTAALNIRRYLQQPVIIYGQRGYISNLAARQITVERIARLR